MNSASMQCTPLQTHLMLGELITSPVYLSNAVVLKSKETPEFDKVA